MLTGTSGLHVLAPTEMGEPIHICTHSYNTQIENELKSLGGIYVQGCVCA